MGTGDFGWWSADYVSYYNLQSACNLLIRNLISVLEPPNSQKSRINCCFCPVVFVKVLVSFYLQIQRSILCTSDIFASIFTISQQA